MSYQVIARKYRPQRFRDVVGQEHVTQTLSRAIEQKRIAHAYLFCGPRGTGKTTIARIFAKCLNCTGGPRVDFDDQDPKCQEIAEGRSLDVLEIDGASNNGVEQVRELRETCRYAPASSPFKIYIIDEVHMLSAAAFNALLKTLEEPPAHVKFMFATTDPEKVLPTILSRCQRFDLRRIPAALIGKQLSEIAKIEKVKIDSPALQAIARGAEGGMRDAESTLDQLISFCGNEIEESDVLSMFGLTAQAQLLSMTKAILTGEVEAALRELNDLANNGKDLGRLISDLLNHFRNLLIFQVSRGDLTMLEVSESEIAALKEQSKLISAEALTRIMEVLASAEMKLRDATSRKILLEVTLLKTIEARNAQSIDSVIKQLGAMRGTGGSGGHAAGLPMAAAPATEQKKKSVRAEAAPAAEVQSQAIIEATTDGEARAVRIEAGISETVVAAPQRIVTQASAEEVFPVSPAEASAPGVTDVTALWTSLFGAVAATSRFAAAYLTDAHPVSFSNNTFVIGFDPSFEEQLGLVDNPKNHALLQTKLTELGYANCLVKFIKAANPNGGMSAAVQAPMAATPAPAIARPAATVPTARSAPPMSATAKPVPIPFDKDTFKNDPLIQKALEIFKGQIVRMDAGGTGAG